MESTLLLPKAHHAHSKRTATFPKLLVAPTLVSLAILSSLYVVPPLWQFVLETTDSFAKPSFPDFSQYQPMRTIAPEELGLNNPDRRVIFFGDVHGNNVALSKLLDKVEYDSTKDTLIHTGDFLTKGLDSLGTIQHLAALNASGVRGNHDQRVVEWRGWLDWVAGQPGGQEWLELTDDWSKKKMEADKKKKGKKHYLPDGWKWNDEHRKLAAKLNDVEYNYLRNLPLVIHIPSLHTFAVHAGILPIDPTRSTTNRRQPLARAPEPEHPSMSLVELRNQQERALFTDIPQNQDPWVTLNIRSLTDDGVVSRSNDENPWSDLWGEVMNRCDGFDVDDDLVGPGQTMRIEGRAELKGKPGPLPCHPITVVYGHAATRGLDLKRWSKGLDSGCAYERELTAMIVQGAVPKHKAQSSEAEAEESLDDEEDDMKKKKPSETVFGAHTKARIVSAPCH
ncbi:hypothetical protein BOTBODRAFT_43820 [Botryobasidium botryosum FD-172 SS1]|uniref:Calcineurin-like phosphoesterase domain-containing protein n=1 Tax=Botryobasidium botryosum (strain FD-172 SS1) TaxID=930990 RepID=A0A067MWJ7_BOTB1|nr:hypothetical protein BOTBODRAFT_43820 [Botryobasidium botryosum FD-172 SS1]